MSCQVFSNFEALGLLPNGQLCFCAFCWSFFFPWSFQLVAIQLIDTLLVWCTFCPIGNLYTCFGYQLMHVFIAIASVFDECLLCVKKISATCLLWAPMILSFHLIAPHANISPKTKEQSPVERNVQVKLFMGQDMQKAIILLSK